MIKLESSKKFVLEMDNFRLCSQTHESVHFHSLLLFTILKGENWKVLPSVIFLLHLLPASIPFQRRLYKFFCLWPVGEGICTLNGKLLRCLRLLTQRTVKRRSEWNVTKEGETLATKLRKNEDPEILNWAWLLFLRV